MALRPTKESRERILLFGPSGSGKSQSILSIAHRSAQTGSPAQFYVMDTDYLAYDRMLEESYPELTNVHVRSTFTWEEYRDNLKDYQAAAGVDDFLVVDMVGPGWDAVQEYFIQQIFGKDADTFFFEARKQQKKGNALDGFKDWCVDPATEVMTIYGWRTVDQLTVGDFVLGLDEETGTSRWQPILELYRGPARLRSMVAMHGVNHDSLTTPDHRWLVRSESGALVWSTSSTLKRTQRIPTAVPHGDFPSMAKYADTFVELVAWFWTEGDYSTYRDAPMQGHIAQSNRRNANNVTRIRTALQDAFPGGWSETTRANGVVIFTLNKATTTALLEVAPGKVPAPEFLLSLTAAQLQLFITTSIDGDGTSRSTGQRTWFQSDADRVAAFEMACALAGIATTTHQRLDHDGNTFAKKPRWTVTLHKTAHVNPVNGAYMKAHDPQGRGRMTVNTVDYDGEVWCPVTPSGTWLARRNGTVYYTGNTVINRLWRSWMNDLMFKTKGHVICTTGVDAVSDSDDKALRALFAIYGVKPRGQKHLPHPFHTILLTQCRTPGEDYTFTAVKDRGREAVKAKPVKDFAIQYLVQQAGWAL